MGEPHRRIPANRRIQESPSMGEPMDESGVKSVHRRIPQREYTKRGFKSGVYQGPAHTLKTGLNDVVKKAGTLLWGQGEAIAAYASGAHVSAAPLHARRALAVHACAATRIS